VQPPRPVLQGEWVPREASPRPLGCRPLSRFVAVVARPGGHESLPLVTSRRRRSCNCATRGVFGCATDHPARGEASPAATQASHVTRTDAFPRMAAHAPLVELLGARAGVGRLASPMRPRGHQARRGVGLQRQSCRCSGAGHSAPSRAAFDASIWWFFSSSATGRGSRKRAPIRRRVTTPEGGTFLSAWRFSA